MTQMVQSVMSNEDFIDRLGVEFENAGGLYRIVCPFHDDHDPSMVVYDDHCHCYSCGESFSFPYVYAKIKNCSFPEACRALEWPEQDSNTTTFNPQMNFCVEPNPLFTDVFTEKFSQCSTEFPENAVKWLEHKKLLETAKKLDWRWHDGTVFTCWTRPGIVIPYKQGDKVVWVRQRTQTIECHFAKPIGPPEVGIQPYYDCFRKNDAVYWVEGESDAASIYKQLGSAIGIPGAKAKKAINSVACFINDNDYIKTVVLCGDRDHAGQDMNSLCRNALGTFVKRPIKIIEYEHKCDDKKSDVNDDLVKGELHLPVEHWDCYDENHTRNYGLFGA